VNEGGLQGQEDEHCHFASTLKSMHGQGDMVAIDRLLGVGE